MAETPLNNNGGNSSPSNEKVTYTPEEQSFHKNFPDVPLNEKLVESYQCGLSKNKVVSMGRLYLTSIRVAFFASFPKKSMNVEWSSVYSIEKRSNFLFEAVVVTTTAKEEHFFSAFMFGQSESAQKLMHMLWSVRNKYGVGGGSGAPRSVAAAAAAVAPTPTASSNSAAENPGLDDHAAAAGTSGLPRIESVPDGASFASLAASATPSPAPATASIAVETKAGASAASTEASLTSAFVRPVAMAAVPAEEPGHPIDREDTDVPAPLGVTAPQTDDATPGILGETTAVQPTAATTKPMWGDDERASSTEETPNATDGGIPPTPPPSVNVSFATHTVSLDAARTATPETPPPAPEGPESGNTAANSATTVAPPTHSRSSSQQGLLATLAAVEAAAAAPTRQPTAVVELPPVATKAAAPPLPAAPQVVTAAPSMPAKGQHGGGGPRGGRNRGAAIAGADDPESPSASANDGSFSSEALIAAMPSKHRSILSHFPLVPPTETIIDSFQCSYVSGVHRLGKMHITTNYVLFTSVMFTEGVCVKFSDVRTIEKQTTMVVFEGIIIGTKGGKQYEFTSFANRDAAFRILQQLHVAHVGKQQLLDKRSTSPARAEDKEKPSSTAAQPAMVASQSAAAGATLTSAATGDYTGMGPGAPGFTPPVAVAAAAAAAAAGGASDSNSAMASISSPRDFACTSISELPSSGFEFLTSTSQPHFDSFPACSSIADFDKYSTDFGTGISPTEKLQEKIIVEDTPFPKGFTVIDIFRFVFDDDTKLLDKYHAERKDSGMEWEQWRPCLGSAAQQASNNGQRQMKCKTIIKAMFQTTCDFTEFSKYAFLNVNDKPTLLVHFSGQAVGVPQSDTFRAETLLVFTQVTGKSVDESAQVVARVYGHIQFTKTCWIKGKILKTALGEEMPDSYATMIRLAKEYVAPIPPSRVGMRPPAPRAIAEAELNKRELRASIAPPAPPSPTFDPSAVSGFASHRAGGATGAGVPSGAPLLYTSPSPFALPADGPLLLAAQGSSVLGLLWVIWGLWSVFWASAPAEGGEVAAMLLAVLRPVAMAILYLLFIVFISVSKPLLKPFLPE